MVTERVAGITLHDLLELRGPFAAEMVAAIVAQAAVGLQAMHDHTDRRQRALEWVHARLSPRVIVLSWSGRVVLLNVGLGELVSPRNGFEYFSPEQARSAPVDRRSDVFALGLILYEGLTGSRPFAHQSLPDYMLSVLADEPKNPCELCVGLAPELGRIAMRCLERDPEARFGSARELADALRACPGIDTAASEDRLSTLLVGRFARERSAEDELSQAVAAFGDSLPLASDLPAGRGGRRFRPLFLLLILAIAVLIAIWAGVSRGASTC